MASFIYDTDIVAPATPRFYQSLICYYISPENARQKIFKKIIIIEAEIPGHLLGAEPGFISPETGAVILQLIQFCQNTPDPLLHLDGKFMFLLDIFFSEL